MVVKLVVDGPQQMLAAEMMREPGLPGWVKTKVVPFTSESGKKLKGRMDKKLGDWLSTQIPYNAFMVMEFAQGLTNLSQLDLGLKEKKLSDQDFDTLVQNMKTSRFFYDLGRIHGADMYIGNEDRLGDARTTAIKNIFVNKGTGQLLPIDLGLVAVSQDRATKRFEAKGKLQPASVKGHEAEDWINSTITGSFEENRLVPGKKSSEQETTTRHGNRGAAFPTPDFRLAVLGDRVGTVWNRFKVTMGTDWNKALDADAEKEFRVGIGDAIKFYTSRTSGHWAEKVESVKEKFDLGPEEMLYLDAGVFALKDRYAELVKKGYDDAEACAQLEKEVKQGIKLWAGTTPQQTSRATSLLAPERMPKPTGSISTTSISTTTSAPATDPSSISSTMPTRLPTGIRATGGMGQSFRPFVGFGKLVAADTGPTPSPPMSLSASRTTTSVTRMSPSTHSISDATDEYLLLLAAELDKSSESESEEEREKDKE